MVRVNPKTTKKDDMPHNLKRLYEALSYVFNDVALCKEALTHRSFGIPHNERLEFLGDSVLNFVVTRLLYQRFLQLDEGKLSRLRANLVQQSALAEIAQSLNLNAFLYLGEGEKKNKLPDSILADAMEALLGAIFLDSDEKTVSQVIQKLYANKLNAIDLDTPQKDPKSRLQEFLQARQKKLPLYVLVKEKGEPHQKSFLVRCLAEKTESEAWGHSRQEAEQKAAQSCLLALQDKCA